MFANISRPPPEWRAYRKLRPYFCREQRDLADRLPMQQPDAAPCRDDTAAGNAGGNGRGGASCQRCPCAQARLAAAARRGRARADRRECPHRL